MVIHPGDENTEGQPGDPSNKPNAPAMGDLEPIVPDPQVQPSTQPEFNPTKPSTQGNVVMSFTSLANLIGQSNLIASQQSVPEMDGVIKVFRERLESLRQNTATVEQKAMLPKDVQTLTSSVSPNLPGIAIYTVIGSQVLVMPVLFTRDGIVDITETIQIGTDAPRGFAKAPASFIDTHFQKRVHDAFMWVDGTKMSAVFLANPRVVNLERWNKKNTVGEALHQSVAKELLNDWSTGLNVVSQLYTVKESGKLEQVFVNGRHLFGQHQTAIARVEAINTNESEFVRPYANLAVKVVTAPKNGQNFNSSNQQTQSVCEAHLNVQIDVMSPQQYATEQAKRPFAATMGGMGIRGVGPLFPVISIGSTKPGETLGHNRSIVSMMMGLYASLAANKQEVLAEAIRGKVVGNRGNLTVFNSLLASYLGAGYTTANYLTDTTITNLQAVSTWLNTYMSENAVFVIDAPAFLDNSSETEFWTGLATKDNSSTFAKAAIAAVDVLCNGKFSEIALANAAKGQNRNKAVEWAPGDSILTQTNYLRPYGMAMTKDGTPFDLSEIDQMFMRQDAYFGAQEQLIAEYTGTVAGTIPQDLRVRQYNIINLLQRVLNNSVRFEGWGTRYVVSSAFVSTLAAAMANAGVLTVSASQYAGQWAQSYDNSLLGNAMTANLLPQQIAQMGMSPIFNNQY